MITVSLITLALLINAIACALAFRYVQREFRLTLNALTKKLREQRRSQAEAQKQWAAEATDLRDAFNQLRAIMPEKDKGLSLGHSFKDKMEERYIRAQEEAKRVTVRGVPENN